MSKAADGLRLGIQRVLEAKSGKNRLHLDLTVRDLDDETGEVEDPPRVVPRAG
jgi:hypothetical protein